MREPATIPEQFDAVAARYGDHPALTHARSTTTYRELGRRSDDLAAALGGHGVGDETVVAVYAERSIELIVALLGVLKAGGTYVCLDPSHPKDRIERLVAESNASAVVTCVPHTDSARELGLPVIDIITPSPGAGVARPRPAPLIAPDALAYIVFTSGSTGRPKGVGITHRNLLGLVRGQEYASFGPDETYLQLSPTSFDASAFEIWGALLSGARLVIPAASYHALDTLPDVLTTERVTMLLLTPPLFHELVRRRIDCFGTVRRLVVGAEAMSVAAARTYLAHARERGASFANVYGPTEATTLVSCFEITDLDAPDTVIPIGSPISGATIHLLDEQLNLVRPGETGHIHIGGTGVARGYVGRPGLTASRFLADPHSGTPGARMYATGDLGLLRPDGEIEFRGRIDDQVKIRGHRVEPGEVEAVLAAHPGVVDVAVTVRTTNIGSHQLVAHVVPASHDNELERDLADFAATRLPGYLRPSSILMTPSLPLTASGKIDRKTLAALPSPHPAEHVATPPTDRFSALTRIWQDVLGVDRIEPDDDFFALGGDSLLAIRVISDAETSGIRIALADLFATPTIRALTEAAGQPPAPTGDGGESPGRATPAPTRLFGPDVEAVYPATQMQLGLLFEAEAAPDSALYLDVVSRRIAGTFDEALFSQAVRLTLRRHPALRTRFDLSTLDTPMQVVRRDPAVDLVVADLRDAAAEEVGSAVSRDERAVTKPFSTQDTSLIRFRVVRISATEYQVTYGFHHAVMDGWSETVFAGDLFGCYDALLRGEQPTPAAIAAGYRRFVELEQDSLSSGVDRRYWLERCGALRPTPTATGGGRHGPDRHSLVVPLPREIVEGMRHRSRDWRMPYKSLIVAGHLAALGRVLGHPEPVTGLVVNGRPETGDADRLVGLFLNVLPMSAFTEQPWRALVGEVFEQEKAMLPHRRFPYPALRELMGDLPLFDVAFNYVQFHRATLLRELDGVRVVDTRIKDKTSFPLAFDVEQSPDGAELVIEAAAATDAFSAADLETFVTAHVDSYRLMANDSSATVVNDRA